MVINGGRRLALFFLLVCAAARATSADGENYFFLLTSQKLHTYFARLVRSRTLGKAWRI
jgi:hypothetical protein